MNNLVWEGGAPGYMNMQQCIKSSAMLFSIVLSITGRVAFAQDVIVYTENYPPFNYLNEEGEVVGLATENVKQVLEAAELSYDIKLLPWARAMQQVEARDNALIYTITRTPNREQQFHWLVPLAPTNFHVFMRAKDDRIVTKEALRAGEFTGSCISTDLTCELLQWIGLPEDKIFPIAKQTTGDFLMVSAGRADIYVSELAVNKHLRIMNGYDPTITKPVMKFEARTGFYIAGGLKLDEDIKERIRKAYGALLDSGSYNMLDLGLEE